MKLTEIERTIIVINIIGSILDEYEDDEITYPVQTLIDKCIRFKSRQSGTEERLISGKLSAVIVDAKRYHRYFNASKIGYRIWCDAVDHFKKQKLTIDAVALVEAVYLFHEKIITKHTTIKRADIDAYRYENNDNSYLHALNGTAVGGHLMGLLARESGEIINGKLRALKLKKEDELGRAA